MSCDPNILSENARANDAIPPGLRWPTLIYLFCQIANIEPSDECINIVPAGATYFEGNYSLLANGIPVIVGAQYTITFGANELEATNFGQPDIISPGPGIPVVFTATNSNLIFQSAPGHLSDPVTATVCVVGQSPPATPTNLDIDVTDVTADPATFFTKLTWQSANVPDRFEIWRQVNSGSYALLAVVSGGIFIYSDDCTTDVLMPQQDSFTYKVRAKTGSSFSAFSNEIQSAKGITLQFDNSTVSLSYPLLVVSFFDVMVVSNSVLTSVSFAKLKRVSTEFQIFNNGVLTSISVPAMASFGFTPVFDSFAIDGNPIITSINLSSIVGINGTSFTGSNCTALTTITFNAAPTIPDVGNSIVFEFCNLSAATVNRILAIGVANGLTQAFIALDGGTSAAPTGQGIIDKATLIVNGCTVFTN